MCRHGRCPRTDNCLPRNSPAFAGRRRVNRSAEGRIDSIAARSSNALDGPPLYDVTFSQPAVLLRLRDNAQIRLGSLPPLGIDPFSFVV